MHLQRNKTLLYLFPILTTFGYDFKKYLYKLKIVQVKIGDKNIKSKHCLFLVFEINNFANNEIFYDFLNYVSYQDYYFKDYILNMDYLYTYHVIAIKLPKKYYISYNYFLKSEYAKMYDKETINKIFKKEEVIKVLTNEQIESKIREEDEFLNY